MPVPKARKPSTSAPLALIIDDEAAICDSLAGALEDAGWRTVSAGSGRQGMVEYKAHPPDLVFLDVWMPEMDGIETLQLLKEMRGDIPIVIMSGHGTIETAVRTTKLGAFFILDKLQENQWNVSKTADAIGIERSNLHRKLRAYNIDPKRLKE